MGMMKKAGALGVAKLLFDQARRPENQARIKKVVSDVQARRRGPGPARRPR